jgi:hypothetical protein
MGDWRRTDRTTQDKVDNRTGRDVASSGGLFQGYISSSSGTDQNALLVYAGGSSSTPLPMPFESTDSWIRSIPLSGSAALITYRRDSREATFIRYLNDAPTERLAAYQQGLNLYKPLLPGEHEVHSSGLAQTYYSQRPVLEQRGGIIRSWLDQDRAESGQKAPIHTRQLHTNLTNAMGDEERFGVVRRPIKLNIANALLLGQEYSSNFYMYPYPDFSLPGGIPAAYSTLSEAIAKASEAVSALTGTFKIRPFAKEYLRVIKNPLYPLPPTTLIDIREGQVFDDDGIQLTGDSGAYLRAKRDYYTTIMDTTTETIDELGNVSWTLSYGATKGWYTSVPTGSWKLEANLGIDMSTLTSLSTSSLLDTSISATTDISLDSTLNTDFSTGLNFSHSANGTWDASSMLAMSLESNMNFTAKAGLIFEAEGGVQMNLKAPIVQIGSSPSEPTVMGTQLSTWLQTLCQLFTNNAANIGMGNMSAPVPLSPAILSGIANLTAQIPLLTSKTITVTA